MISEVRPQTRRAAAMRPFGEQSHPSRRVGGIKQHTTIASTVWGGAAERQAALPDHRQQTSAAVLLVHRGLQQHPCRCSSLAHGRTPPCPPASTVPLTPSANIHRTPRSPKIADPKRGIHKWTLQKTSWDFFLVKKRDIQPYSRFLGAKCGRERQTRPG
jgi:hypothetical protein